MIGGEPARAADRRTGSPASPSRSPVPTTGLTVYGSERDEAALFREMAPRLGVVPTITDAAVCAGNVGLALGNRCVSVDHRTRVTRSTLRALRHAGVTHVGTRSVGCDHIDVDYAASVGIRVETVSYSPDSVADYTLMLMLMAIRQARSLVRRADVHDYTLNEIRGRELRDLTVGVVGTGRIGAAVVRRLGGFGARILAHDVRPTTSADYVPLDALLRRSDVVTLHTPLTPETRHLLDRRRIEQMRHGAVVVNTGRGALLDTAALVRALRAGRLGGAALDVLEGEEGIFHADHRDRPIASELLLALHELPNVLITPHTAYHTERALRDVVERSLAHCLRSAGADRHG
jgi:D-specific alpha-keto acid dehydrogenase